jgi:hypothetical protein
VFFRIAAMPPPGRLSCDPQTNRYDAIKKAADEILGMEFDSLERNGVALSGSLSWLLWR